MSSWCDIEVISAFNQMVSQCLFCNLGAKEGEKKTVLKRRKKTFQLEAKAYQEFSKLMNVFYENHIRLCVSVHCLSVRQLRSCCLNFETIIFFPFLKMFLLNLFYFIFTIFFFFFGFAGHGFFI